MLLLAAVRLEPAADVLFGVVIAVALTTGRFRLTRVPLGVTLLLTFFLALNLLASVEVVDTARAVEFFAITLYLAALGIWLTGYVQSTDALGSWSSPISSEPSSRRRSRASRCSAAAGSGGIRRRPARTGALQGSERLRAVSRPGGADLDGGDRRAATAAAEAGDEAALPVRRRLGVLFSFSRAAWLNLAVASAVLLVVFALRRGGGRRVMMLFVVVLLAAAAGFGVVSATSTAGFLQERASFQVYDVERFGAQASASTWPPSTRSESGRDSSSASRTFPPTAPTCAPWPSRVLGLVAFLALMLLTLGFAARSAVLGRDTYGIGSAALLAAWCGLLANSLFIDTLHWRHLWLLAALIWAGARFAPATPRGMRRERHGRPRSRCRASSRPAAPGARAARSRSRASSDRGGRR